MLVVPTFLQLLHEVCRDSKSCHMWSALRDDICTHAPLLFPNSGSKFEPRQTALCICDTWRALRYHTLRLLPRTSSSFFSPSAPLAAFSFSVFRTLRTDDGEWKRRQRSMRSVKNRKAGLEKQVDDWERALPVAPREQRHEWIYFDARWRFGIPARANPKVRGF